jgi:hypothetical protein
MIYAKDINEHTPWQDLTPAERYMNRGLHEHSIQVPGGLIPQYLMRKHVNIACFVSPSALIVRFL